MKAVILCTGQEKGLLPINERTPDAMLRLAGSSAAELLARRLAAQGAESICVLCGFLCERIREHFELSDMEVRVEVCEQGERLFSKLLQISGGEDILLVEGCGVFGFSFCELWQSLGSSSAVVAAANLGENITAPRLCFEGGELTRFCLDRTVRTEGYDGVFAQAAVFSAEALSAVSGCGSISEAAAKLLARGDSVGVFPVGEGNFQSVATPKEYLCASLRCMENADFGEGLKILSEGIYSQEEHSLAGITLIPPVYLGRGVTLAKGCVIENSVIEDNAVIGARAEVRHSLVGEAAHVGAGAQLERAIVCAAAKLLPAARLGEESVVGERAIAAAGVQVMPGVRIFADKRTRTGEVISEDVTCGVGGGMLIDDDCCFGFSSGVCSPLECAAFGMAVGTALAEGTAVVCGCSEGRGAEAALAAFESGLSAAGITVLSVGRCSGREVMFLTNRLGAQLGCFVSVQVSEQIRLMRRGGLEPESRLQAKIERAAALARYRILPFSDYGVRHELGGAAALYEIFLAQLLPPIFSGLCADVRCSDIPTAKAADSLIRRRSDRDGERVIFHISSDGGSCTAYSDDSGYVSGERLILVAVKAAFERDIPVSLPYTFPMAADKLAERFGGKLYRYFHGARDDEDKQARSIAERPDNFFVRDGMVLMCVICAYLSQKRITLAKALADIPQFYSAHRFAAAEGEAEEIYKALGCRPEGGSDGVVAEGENQRAVVRPLRHRQGLMIFAESVKAEAASELCDDIMQRLKREAY